MKNIFKNKKFILVASIITSILIVGVSGTLAWYFWSSGEDERTKIVTSVGAATIVYDDGASLIGQNLKPVDDKAQGIVKNISVRTNIDTVNRVSFNLYLDINELDEGLKHESFRYELYQESVETPITFGNFTQDNLNNVLKDCTKNSTSHIVLLNDVTITKKVSSYTLYIWIDGNMVNPDTMMDQDFSFKLHADGQGAMISESELPNIGDFASGTLAYNIVSMYNNSNDIDTVYNGGVKYYYDTANNLMSDVAGNVRYYGADPNNYVYFNCDAYPSTNCEKWRIIGVVDGKVKIVRDKVLGKYSWDYDETESYYNNWHTSSMNALLNGGYYNNLDGVIYNNYYTTSGLSPKTINFASSGIGIKNTTTRDMISESTWYLGGHDDYNIYPADIYRHERGNKICQWCNFNTQWTGNIGLMYPSDYAYAADLSVCDKSLSTLDEDSDCLNTNWIRSGDNIWLITPSTEDQQYVWRVYSAGNISTNGSSLTRQIFPTLYLDENVIVSSGDGSSDDPYRLILGEMKTTLELGDYVYYEPIVESYETLTDKTGYSDVQTIYPKELTLWRVLFINEDGTVDLVSEDVSSTRVWFSNLAGYQNLVGYLNELANQYKTEGITVRARHFGYNGQIEKIEDTSMFTETAPWLCSTGEDCIPAPVESQGGGDTLYERDYNQVQSVLKTAMAYNVNTSTLTAYWMASRHYFYLSSGHYWAAVYVNLSGEDRATSMYNAGASRALRPVVTLSSELSYEGLGIKEAPMRIITN